MMQNGPAGSEADWMTIRMALPMREIIGGGLSVNASHPPAVMLTETNWPTVGFDGTRTGGSTNACTVWAMTMPAMIRASRFTVAG